MNLKEIESSCKKMEKSFLETEPVMRAYTREWVYVLSALSSCLLYSIHNSSATKLVSL